MNLQTQNSGQICGQTPNQAGTVLSGSGLPQQNGNSFPSQMQNNNGRHVVSRMDPVIIRARRYMQERILHFLSERWGDLHRVPRDRAIDLVKRLEEALFRTAKSKEEYLNMETLERRLHVLTKRLMSNGNQLIANTNTNPSIGAMIPTPGFQQTENSSSAGTLSVASSLAINSSNAVAPPADNSESCLPAQEGSVGGLRRAFASGYQQPSCVFTKNTGANNTVTSMSIQSMVTQMIPTPGINNSNDNGTKSMANNHTFMNMEPSNSMGAFAAVESTTTPCPMLQNQPVRCQNNRSLHNIGQHTGGGIKSTLQGGSFGLSSGQSNGGMGVMGKSMLVMHGPGTNSDQLEGNGYGDGVVDTSGSGNSNEPVTFVGSMLNKQSLGFASPQFILKRSHPLMANDLSNLYSAQQVTDVEPQSFDQSENVNLQLERSLKENSLQHHRHQQPSHESQDTQIAQHQVGQSKQMQNKLLLRCDSFIQSQHPSNTFSEEKSGIGTQHHDEGLHSQAFWSSQFPKMQNQHQVKSKKNHSRATQSDPENIDSLSAKASGQMQQLLQPQLVGNTTSDFTGHCDSIQPNTALHGQSYSKLEDVSYASEALPLEQNVQDGFHQQMFGGDVAQLNNLLSGESLSGQCDSSRSAEPLKTTDTLCRSHKWLLFLKHARKCSASEGKCFDRRSCAVVQKLWEHMERCNVPQCTYPRCRASRGLINHHLRCQNGRCPVCVPVKNFVQERKALGRAHFDSGSPSSVNSSCNSHDTAQILQKSTLIMGPTTTQTPEDLQPPLKRQKIEQGSPSNISENACPVALISCVKKCEIEDAQNTEQQHDCIQMKFEFTGGDLEAAGSAGQSNPGIIEIKKNSLDDAYAQSHEGDAVTPNNLAGLAEPHVIKTENDIEQPKLENAALLSENASKTGKSKIKGVSMVELFTIEQVQDHITSLRQWIGQSKVKAERNQAMGNSVSENSCQLCRVEKLIFEPPPIYCTRCGARIKKNAMYYGCGVGETRLYFCIPCYNEARGDTIVVDGGSFPKTRLVKKKNDEETEEGWVLCDKCNGWQHQICALFNGRRNRGGQAEYTCPNCYVAELESGERVPLLQSSVLGAKDLPRTNLSDHLEQRLFAKLKQEREQRAKLQGICYDEVPGAEDLVVRVVSSVDKKLDVKPRFLEIFQDQNYVSKFPYKSKVILLFQRIGGVEVCIFGMYVQEYGSECQQPNHRRVYLSYLDSVKYFRPEVKAATGEALRTFVYHEILIGYLEYCKKRGFTSCYIWACPPLKGEDYILYCHPEIQKTPKSDKLREWYLVMLRKAVREEIVVDLTNLYEHFFVSDGERKAKVTAARLPYFDGDYWPGAAEDIICQLQQEDGDSKQPKKGAIRKGINKRALRASGQTDLSCNSSKDLILMQKLGETISPLREDFIIVHLQHACTHCSLLMVSGNRWVCKQCKNFQLCDKCYDAEQICEEKERHPAKKKDKHALHPVEITGVPDDTKDNEILESEFFDTRQAFLSLCQGNHYQYDTLRRAKHSSMMVLYHLHNPTAPAFVTQCAACRLDIEAGQGWHCETCPDYDVCDACYRKNGGKDHPHMLTNKKFNDHDAQNKEARKSRVLQLRKMLDLLAHASQCHSLNCQNLKCRKVKGLFRHGMGCKTRASRGCHHCLNMWQLLQLHARACNESECHVPRCKDLKEHMRRQQHQSDSRRRAAVVQMMMQRSEFGNNS